MSTILQALQRADADRGRGQVPNLHAAPVALPLPGAAGQPASSLQPALLHSPRVWLGAGTLLLAGGLLAWVALRQPGPGAPPPVSATPAVPAIAVAAAPPISDTNVPPAQYPVATSASDSIAKKSRNPGPVATSPLPGVRSDGKTPAAPVVAPASGATTATTSVALISPAVPLAEAPDEVRRLVPTLAISGAVYSNERGQRMVIANGQVLHEGDAWGTDSVVIDEIRPRSVVLRVRGQRVMLPL